MPAYGVVLLALAWGAAVWLLRRAVMLDASLAPYFAGAAFLMIAGMHQRRPDLHFLDRHLHHSRLAMAAEYGVLVLPVLLGLLFAGAWIWATLTLFACALAWTPALRASGVRGGWLRRSIPVRLFEWKSAVQGTYPWSVVLWLGALAFCWLPVLPLFLLGGLALMACGAQEQCEPRSMLLATASNASTLLRTKLGGALRLMLAVHVPVLFAATWFRPEWWWIHALFGLGMLAVVLYAVVLKYARYQPMERLSGNSANVTTAAVFAILPGLCVVPIIMLLTELRPARENLSTYFHDHDHRSPL